MEFYELVLYLTYFGQRCVNVFNFTMSGTPASVSGAFGLAYAFGAIPDGILWDSSSLFGYIRAITVGDAVFNQVRVKNPYDVTDFYSVPFAAGVNGLFAGEAMSPVLAYGVHSNQVRLDIRAGSKRFVGVAENAVDSGGVIDGSFLPSVEDVGEAMSAPLTYDDEGNTLTYNVVVAKKFNDLEADPPIKNAYWPTKAEQLANIASGCLWTAMPNVRSQVSRQYGHGR